ncbi:hypothetical protein ACO22_05820 [Paracoccidioides brasiliensis]|uniref:Uncharacterized protein n=1 Tax=Paracoccidioides brasiliensis TaxID=121759 RepID=A0A1D2J978_PARBR|nr:hypothetical protein ACO22_05820 [Paracoccidioides brasiliensis]
MALPERAAFWEASDLHHPVQEGDSPTVSRPIHPYSKPPLSTLCNAPKYHQVSGQRLRAAGMVMRKQTMAPTSSIANHCTPPITAPRSASLAAVVWMKSPTATSPRASSKRCSHPRNRQ